MSLEVTEMQELKEKLFGHLKNGAHEISFQAARLLVDIAKKDIYIPKEKPSLARDKIV